MKETVLLEQGGYAVGADIYFEFDFKPLLAPSYPNFNSSTQFSHSKIGDNSNTCFGRDFFDISSFNHLH